ncbi:MAG: tetratricopeptide repeat protein [Francisellaceae bacterium]
MKKILLLLIIISLLGLAYLAFLPGGRQLTNEQKLAVCEKAYNEIQEVSVSLNDKLIKWEKNKSCQYQNFYQYYLAQFMMENNQHALAVEYFDKLIKNKAVYAILRHKSSLKLHDIYWSYNYEKCLYYAKIMLEDYPKWGGGYSEYGGCLLGVPKPDFYEAIKYLEKSNIDLPTMGAYGGLVLSYYQTKQYQKALDALNKGASLDSAIYGFTGIMNSAIYAAMDLDQINKADELMKKLIQHNPSAAEDQDYIKVRTFVDNYYREHGKVDES